jgi:tetratricopeptide (TPR) repeat protein
MERIKSIFAFLSALLIGGAIIYFQAIHFSTAWVILPAMIPLFSLIMGTLALIAGNPSSRNETISNLSIAVIGWTVVGFCYSLEWPTWIILGVVIVFTRVLAWIGKTMDGKQGIGLASLKIAKNLMKAGGNFRERSKGTLEHAITSLKQANSKEVLAEAEALMGEYWLKGGQGEKTRALYLAAADHFRLVGRTASAREVERAVGIKPDAEIAPSFPWREVLNPSNWFWSFLGAFAIVYSLWAVNNSYMNLPPGFWAGLVIALGFIPPALCTSGYGMLRDGANFLIKMVKILLLIIGLAYCLICFGSTFPSLLTAAIPMDSVDFSTSLLIYPMEFYASACKNFTGFLPGIEYRLAVSIGVFLLGLLAAFVFPLGKASRIPKEDKIGGILEKANELSGQGNVEGALQLLADKEPSTVRSNEEVLLVKRILLYIQAGKENEALRFAENCTRESIENRRIVYLLGYLQLKENQVDNAVETFMKARKNYSSPFDTDYYLSIALLSKAYELTDKRKSSEALKYFEEIRSIGVLKIDIPRSLCEIKFIEALKELSRQNPGGAEEQFAHISRETAEGSREQLLGKVGQLIAVINQEDRIPEIKELASTADKAYGLLKKDIDYEADDPFEKFILNLVKGKKDFDEEQIDKRCPRDLYLLAAFLALQAGEIEELEEFIDKSIKIDPNFPEGNLLKGLILYYNKDNEDNKEDAYECLKIAQKQGEISDQSLKNLIESLHDNITKRKKAEESYLELLEEYMMNPETPELVRKAVMSDERIYKSLQGFVESRDHSFIASIERTPSLEDYKGRIKKLKEKFDKIKINLTEAKQKEIEGLINQMSTSQEGLEKLATELTETEKSLITKTGRAVIKSKPQEK